MTKKKRTWKFWTGRTLLALVIFGGLWFTNLIWFRPFNINHFYEKIFVELVLDSPETTTYLGIPVIYDWTKDELDDISDAKLWEGFNKSKEDYKTLLSYDYDNQSEENQLNTDILSYFLKMNTVEAEPYFYHDYPVNQMFGVQSGLPSMMASTHKLDNVSDIEAYISRLLKFETKFSQLIEGLKIREDKGIITPKFINIILLNEMKGFVNVKTDSLKLSTNKKSAVTSNILYTNFETKVDVLEDIYDEEKTAYKNQVADALETVVFPAYQNLISYFENLNLKATNDAGVWKLPNGDAYYRYMLKQMTTTDYTPEEVHNLGLSEVARIKSEMSAILEAENYSDSSKTMGQIIQLLNKEERFLYPDTNEGRQLILKDYKSIIDDISQGMSKAFNIMPKAGMEVKRVPIFKEEGQVSAYYEGPAMDGSRGGVFYANLRDTKETIKFAMKTLAYHEGIPGHHFQIAIQNELQDVPTFRTVVPFTAYSEGWGLYAERLAWELGFYENDPYGNLGRLQAEMFRAVRLVVDTSIHYKKWTREEAIEYMVENTGMTTSEVTSEIERYIVMPGQACAYKIGMLKILELREKAKQELGSQFDLREFHNAVLKNGSLPLDILEEVINNYITDTREKSTS